MISRISIVSGLILLLFCSCQDYVSYGYSDGGAPEEGVDPGDGWADRSDEPIRDEDQPDRTCDDIAQDMLAYQAANSACSIYYECVVVETQANFIENECCGLFLSSGVDSGVWQSLESELRSHDPECTQYLREDCCSPYMQFPACFDGMCMPRTDVIMEEERRLCGESGGEWEEDSCGHNPCGNYFDCAWAIPGCRCPRGRNFFSDGGCQHDDNCLAPECLPYVTVEQAIGNIQDYAGTSVCVVGMVLAGEVVCCDESCPDDPCCCCYTGNMRMWTPEIEYPGVELEGLPCQVDASQGCTSPSCPLVSGNTYVTCGPIARLSNQYPLFQYRQEVTNYCPY